MNRRRFRLSSGALAALAGAVVFLIATQLFPYHTANHDEAVYLQQAAMLLEGQLAIRPPVPEAFRPWFFVADGARLYPKYAPVPAAMFAVGKLVGTVRLSLTAIAAANVALTAGIAAAAFDRRTGLLAAAFLLGSPLFLVDSAVFLPYAPTTCLNLLFAFAYFRAARAEGARTVGRRRTRAWALLAGVAIGAAFFARPYTAVLFAAPFIVHAAYSLWVDRSLARLARLSLTALGGLAGVAAALTYNAAMTGSPLVFPYEAFAPRDGLGFGHREILGYAREYTPELALRANAEVVRTLFAEWVVAGPVGALLALLGLAIALRRASRPARWRGTFTDAQARAILAGLFLTVIAGNVYFWGNLNILGSLDDPTDGLIAALGPYYHFDLLVPTAAFAARGALAIFDRLHESTAARTGRPRTAALALAFVGALALAGATGAVLAPTVQENAETTAAYERAYQPFEDREPSNAVVFLPTPYGDWLNHPFQHLRNDPDFDGEVVYALRDGPDDLRVAGAYPNRSYYRYVYRGDWAPYAGETVDPALRRVERARGDRVAVNASFGVPASADRVSARVATDEGVGYYTVEGTPATLSATLRVASGSASLDGPAVRPVGENATVPVADADEVVVQVFVSDGAGGFSYRLELPVRRANGTVSALSPYREVCLIAEHCDGEAAYVPDAVPDDVAVETDLSASGNESNP